MLSDTGIDTRNIDTFDPSIDNLRIDTQILDTLDIDTFLRYLLFLVSILLKLPLYKFSIVSVAFIIDSK